MATLLKVATTLGPAVFSSLSHQWDVMKQYPTPLSRARVGEKKMTSPTSTTTSTSQWQRDQDSTCDSELGKLVGARTNNHSTTSSIPVTAVYTKPSTAVPELPGSGFEFQWKLHACAQRDLAKFGQGY